MTAEKKDRKRGRVRGPGVTHSDAHCDRQYMSGTHTQSCICGVICIVAAPCCALLLPLPFFVACQYRAPRTLETWFLSRLVMVDTGMANSERFGRPFMRSYDLECKALGQKLGENGSSTQNKVTHKGGSGRLYGLTCWMEGGIS